MDQVKAPCSWCGRVTTHNVLYEIFEQADDWVENNKIIRCAGCETVSFCRQTDLKGDECVYFPSPVSRREPDWVLEMHIGLVGGDHDASLGDLFSEIYQAVNNRQYRLAAMGIRAALEQIIINKISDHGTFFKNLDEFHKQGYISLIQRDTVNNILEVGHAAIHRAYKPTKHLKYPLIFKRFRRPRRRLRFGVKVLRIAR